MSNRTLVKFENVGLRYEQGSETLKDVNFSLHEGSFHFLTGPSGAGKTSLLKLLFMAQKPTRGKIHMFGKDIAAQRRSSLVPLRRQIGVVYQDFRLLNHLTAFDNVALPLRIAGYKEHEVRHNVTEMLNWVELGSAMHALPSTLSGGQQQRVAIARAVINRPRLLLADEPTGNVDAKIGVKLMHLFEELHKYGTTIIIATHDTNLLNRFPHPHFDLQDGSLVIRPPSAGIGDRGIA